MTLAKIADLYGINSVQHGKALVTVFPDYKTKFGSYYERLTKHEGWTDEKFRKLNVFPAAYMDYMWKRCAFGVGALQLVSVVNIELPIGLWDSNIDCVLPYGTVEGNGTFVSYPTNDSTQIVMNNAGWLGALKAHDDKPLRTLFVSPTYGQENWVGGYHESMELRNVRLTGGAPQWMDTTYKSYGLYVYDMGETGEVRKIYAENFNTAGFCFERSTPATAGGTGLEKIEDPETDSVLTAFNCNFCGVHLIGTALATLNFGTVSVDDCPSIFHMEPGRGREAGGVLNVACIKKETAVTPEERGPWKGTIIGYFQGQFAVTIGAISNAAAMVKVNTAFFVNPRLLNGTPQNCSIKVEAIKGFNCDALIQDAVNKVRWPYLADFEGGWFNYVSKNGGKVKVNDDRVPHKPCNCQDRLGFFKGPGTFDYTNCLPKYSYTGVQ
jgi:hypothetical protein